MSGSDNRAEAIVNAALDLPVTERTPYLDKVCGGDAQLRELVEGLLRAHQAVFTYRPLEEAKEPVAWNKPPEHHVKNEAVATQPTLDVALTAEEQWGEKIGRYKILQKIGEGGCGVVYMAEQEEPVRRRVALKVIKLGMDTKQVIARFEAERQALALMDHPNIAKVLDAGATQTGRPYFAMELVKGIPITRYCDENKLDTRRRLDLFIKVCQAVQHAHQKGIIHRDIKPSNILVTLHDGVPMPKVIDFGIAKATDQRLTDKTLFTALEQFIGTPAYMSPEQAEMSGLDIDTRSDIYSLGVLLYELLTGNTPFDPKKLLAAGLDEMRRIIREQDPIRPSTRLIGLNVAEQTTVAKRRQSEPPKLIHLVQGDLDWIVMKTLEKDRTRRYETANGLAMDIQRHLNNEAVLARPPTNVYRFKKLVRRNKVAFAAASAVAAALVIGLGLSTLLFFKERVARERAVAAEEQARQARANESTLRQRAEADEKIARTEAVKSQQVAEFLKEMLNGVGPSVALGRDTTMLREILDKTARGIDQGLKDQPEVEAELRSVIGEVQGALGQYENAEAMHRKALDIRRRLFGDEHIAVAMSLNHLATLRRDQGKLAEAETMHREALAMRRKLLGDEHIDVAQSFYGLAEVLYDRGNLTEAEDLFRQALAMRRRLLGVEHPDVASALNGLGAVLEMQGRLADAEAVHKEALAMRRKLLGSENLAVAESLNDLGAVLQKQGKLAEVESIQREVLSLFEKLVGNEHPKLATSLSNLAYVLHKEGKLEEAEKFARKALAMKRKLLGSEHPDVAISLNNLANVLRDLGNLPEAESMHREALAMRKRLLGENHVFIAASLNNLALVLAREGQLDEAEALERQALEVYTKVLGNEHSQVSVAIYNLAKIVRDRGKLVNAEELARDCLARREKRAGNDWSVLEARSLLGGLLLAQKKYESAEPLLISCYQEMRLQQDKVPLESKPRFRETVQFLIQLYDATGQQEQAADWQNKLKELTRP